VCIPAALAALLAVGFASCGVDAISPLFSFIVDRSATVTEPSTDLAGQTLSYPFTLQMQRALDSNGTIPALIVGTKLIRAFVTSSTHLLGRFKDLQLFVSSDSLSEVLVAKLATVTTADSSVLVLVPNGVELRRAFADSTIHLRLTATLLQPPVSIDSLKLDTKFEILAGPVSPP
jgi:hypothetical protein